MDYLANFQKNVYLLRKEYFKMSRRVLAEKCGSTRTTIYNIEKGNNIPNLENIIKIAEALNTTPGTLLEKDSKDIEMLIKEKYSDKLKL